MSSKLKKTYDPRTGATTVPMPLKACEKLIRISEYLGGPQTATKQDQHFGPIPSRWNMQPTGDIRVGSRLKRTEAVADDEDADAKAGEGTVQDSRDCQQGAKTVQEEAPDEDGSIAEVPQDPGGVTKRSQGVCAEGSDTVSGELVTERSAHWAPRMWGRGRGTRHTHPK